MRPKVLFSALAAIAAPVLAQHQSIGPDIEFDAIHNISSIAGSWSSGSGAVVNGPVSSIPLRLLICILFILFCSNLRILWSQRSTIPQWPGLHILCELERHGPQSKC